jgi:hypothetical protein
LYFIQKIKRRSLDDIAFAEFDRNSNFVLAGSDQVKKIQFLFLFLFLIVFYSKKIRRRSLDDVAFAEFDQTIKIYLISILFIS